MVSGEKCATTRVTDSSILASALRTRRTAKPEGVVYRYISKVPKRRTSPKCLLDNNGPLDKIKLNASRYLMLKFAIHAMDFNVRPYLPTVKFSWPERYISLGSALYGLLLFQARERS